MTQINHPSMKSGRFTEPFLGTLQSLKPDIEQLVAQELSLLPIFSEPITLEIPDVIRKTSPALVIMLGRINRWMAFTEWMALHKSALRSALSKIRGKEDPSEESNDAISKKLRGLNLIVKGVAPISAAVTLVERMTTVATEWKYKKSRIFACTKAADALSEIISLGKLAQMQVDNLRSILHERSEYWRNQIYQSATTFSPKPIQTGMNANGVIDIHVGRDGVRAPLQHVSNASALRASLFGFYLAFREYVLNTNGGLNFLILDDPQDLLDQENRQRLARALSQLAEEGCQILTTTHDRNFGRMLVAEARPKELIAHRSVHPINASRETLETSPAIEELDIKRQAFKKNIDSATHAQDYANEARIFLEARLGDLFDDPTYPAYSTITKPPTLTPYFERLKGLVASKSNELFKSPILIDFCNDPGMVNGSEARRVLNQSHHDKASISYIDVDSIDSDLQRLRKNIEKVHEEFRRFRWREPLIKEDHSNVVSLEPIKSPKFDVPIFQDIAAFVGQPVNIGSQDDSYEILSSNWFENKSLFYVQYDTLGFAVPAGTTAIVEVAPSLCSDHNLVIAQKGSQTYARRLLRPRNGDGISLSAEGIDPRNNRPTLSFEEHRIKTHKIVGLLLHQVAQPEGREEAIELSDARILNCVEVAYRVREDSAVPLALPGQIVLCGNKVPASELDTIRGDIVAVTTSNGACVLKRVGNRLAGDLGYMRQFETIGRLGDSIVLATEDVEDRVDMQRMLHIRPVIGIIYEL